MNISKTHKSDFSESMSEEENKSENIHNEADGETRLPSFLHRLKNKFPRSQKLFWVWIGYHCIKGILTLSLIWIPLLIIWLKSNGWLAD